MAIQAVFIAGPYDSGVQKMFEARKFKIVEDPEEADAAVFTGGSDIHPFLYGQKPIPGCHFNLKRDLEEIATFKTIPSAMPKIGICRGGQLFNILCGGSMYQNVDGHMGEHPMKDLISGRIIKTSSVHHQMMIPGDRAFIIAAAQMSTVKETSNLKINYTEKAREKWDDPEALYYENFNCLCFQGHPESGPAECEDYFFQLIETYFN